MFPNSHVTQTGNNSSLMNCGESFKRATIEKWQVLSNVRPDSIEKMSNFN